MPAFPTTRHSVIERLRSPQDFQRKEAFGDVAGGYWKPVYKYLRVKWQMDAEEAEDATQGFFAEAFEKGWLERFDPSQAKFRTFLRVCVDRLVMNRRQSATREKRGGGARAISIDAFDFGGAEHELAGQGLSAPPEADAFFQREFVRALFDRAVELVRDEAAVKGRDVHWRLFERYDLAGGDPPTYAALAQEFSLTSGQVTGYLAQMRAAFRGHAVIALEALCINRDEFRREARDLLGLEIE
jgi:DNA-directed RNA polymerase specialized sigma24 family protein